MAKRKFKNLCCLVNTYIKCKNCIASVCREHQGKIKFRHCLFCSMVRAPKARKSFWNPFQGYSINDYSGGSADLCKKCFSQHEHRFDNVQVVDIGYEYDNIRREQYRVIKKVKRGNLDIRGDRVYVEWPQSTLIKSLKDFMFFKGTLENEPTWKNTMSWKLFVFLGIE